MTHDPYQQLLSVLDGYTADGAPRSGQLDFCGELPAAAIGLMLSPLFRDLADLMPDEMQSDRVRTAIILVFLRWLRLAGLNTGVRLNRLKH